MQHFTIVTLRGEGLQEDRWQEKDRPTTHADLEMLLPDRVLLLSIIVIIINIIIEYFTELVIVNLIIPNINILNL